MFGSYKHLKRIDLGCYGSVKKYLPLKKFLFTLLVQSITLYHNTHYIKKEN